MFKPVNTFARVLGTITLVLVIGLGIAPYGTSPAHAGENQRSGDCIMSYNYADPGIGYLVATTQTLGSGGWQDPCREVSVTIRNSFCGGDDLASEHGLSYVQASVFLDSGNWISPCSAHYGGWFVEAHWLLFNF